MQHPGLDLWFQAAATMLTTMRKHALAQEGCQCEAWTHHISTMWEVCQAFDNSDNLKILIEFLHCCQFTYNVDQGFVTTMGETGAIDIDVAVAFAAQANSEFLGGSISDEQVAEIDKATDSCNTDTLRKLKEIIPPIEELLVYKEWNTCIHHLTNALGTLREDDPTRDVRSELLAKESISYRLESDVYINADEADNDEDNVSPDASVPVDNITPLYDRVQHVQYAAGEYTQQHSMSHDDMLRYMAGPMVVIRVEPRAITFNIQKGHRQGCFIITMNIANVRYSTPARLRTDPQQWSLTQSLERLSSLKLLKA